MNKIHEVLLLDKEGNIHQTTPGARQLLGVSGSLIGRSLPSLHPTFTLLLEEIKTQPESTHSRMLSYESAISPLQVTMSRLFGGSEPTISVLLTNHHITSSQELQMTIDSIISGFAHEVRNPLAAILSITEAAMSRMEATLPAAQMIGRIPRLINRVDKLLKQSQNYSRPRLPRRAPTSLDQVVLWALEVAQTKKSGIQIQVDLAPNIDKVLVDAEQLEQIVVNLLCNAQDAARSWITLIVRQEASRILLEISDDGPGISECQRSKIFEPFYTTKAQGTGLGLSIAKNLARLNGGELLLLQSSPHGTTFQLSLETVRISFSPTAA